MAKNSQEKKYKVSVVMPAFNEELVIEQTLQTLKEQDYPEEFEIVVCDNNSTDKTSEIAKKMGAKVVFERRKGTRFAYDTAIRESSGEIILITNSDTKLPANWVSKIVKEFEDPTVVGVGTRVRFYGCPDWINWYLDFNWAVSPKKGMWGVSMSCRRWVYEKVGGFNHGVNTNEDAIFQLLIEKHGKIKFVEDVITLMDGRRFDKGVLNAVKEWLKGYGLNSLVVQINYMAFGKIKSLSNNFSDHRSEVFGKGEEYQIATVITVNNDAEYLVPYIYSFKNQNFDKKSCLVALVNNSKDESAKILRLFPWIKVYTKKHDSWAEDILDIVLDVNSSIFAFSTPEARLSEDWLSSIYELYKNDSKLQLVGGSYVLALDNVISKSVKTSLKIFDRIDDNNFGVKRNILVDVLSANVKSQKDLLEELKSYVKKEKFSNDMSVISLKESDTNLIKTFTGFLRNKED